MTLDFGIEMHLQPFFINNFKIFNVMYPAHDDNTLLAQEARE